MICAEAFDAIFDTLRMTTPCIVLDVPHQWSAWTKRALVNADDIVIVAEPDLANLRNTKNMLSVLKTARPNDRPPLYCINQVGMHKRAEIDVNLALAKRSIYTAGLSYGSESGAGIRLGLDRRYLNSRGHKLSTQLDYAQKRKTLLTQYRIPAFKWLDGWYTVALQASDEQTDYIDTRRIELVASRSGQFNDHINLVASIHALRERWLYQVDDDGEGVLAGLDRAVMVSYLPEISAHIGGDLPQPRLVVEGLGEGGSLA